MAINRVLQSSVQNGLPKFDGVWDGTSAVGSMEPISAITLTGSQSSIQFNNIPSTYTNLQIRGLVRTDRSDTNDFMTVRFNYDSSGIYAYHSLYGTGATAAAGDYATSTGTPWSGVIAGGNATASMFGTVIIDILDYANTNKYKVNRIFSGTDQNSTTGRIYFQSNLWQSTSAISTITMTPTYGTNFVTYTSFSLYGIK